MHGDPTPQLKIDMSALVANWRRYDSLPARTAAVVKADAYGLGIERVAPHLVAAGCRDFYVASAAEGKRLRHIVGASPAIYALNGPDEASVATLLEHDLTPVLNSPEQIALWRRCGDDDDKVVLHLDTGMNRLGLDEADWATARELWPRPQALMSHLACAGSPDHPMNRRQLERFTAICARFPAECRKSLCGSFGSVLGDEYLFDEIRPGIGLYGGGPDLCGKPIAVACLSAAVLQTRLLRPGHGCGYDADYVLPADVDPMELACLGIGYADGLLRSCSNRGYAVVKGQRRRIIGRVSMDLTMIDATGLSVEPGMRVELFGPSLPLAEQADACGLLAYELLTAVGARVRRT